MAAAVYCNALYIGMAEDEEGRWISDMNYIIAILLLILVLADDVAKEIFYRFARMILLIILIMVLRILG